jgi:hypothetical protein
LRWPLKFAEIQGFDETPPASFEGLRHEIRAFASTRSSSYETVDRPVSPEAVRQLALFLKDGLRAFASGVSWDQVDVRL